MSRYVRLADNTTMNSVKDFLAEHWGLLRYYSPHPHPQKTSSDLLSHIESSIA